MNKFQGNLSLNGNISERSLHLKFEKIKEMVTKKHIELKLQKDGQSFTLWKGKQLLFMGARLGMFKYLDGIEWGIKFCKKNN
jgi:hypothetical protein